MNTIQEEPQKAFLITLFSYLILLGLLFFVQLWTDVPQKKENLGIEINFGTSDKGSGDVQPLENSVKQNRVTPKLKLEAPRQEVKTPKRQKIVETPLTTQRESPYKINPPTKPITSKSSTPSEVVEKPTQPATPAIDQNSLFKPKVVSNTSTGNHGDDAPGTQGDKGSPTGKLEAKSLYGKGGGGGGFSFDLEGFKPLKKPSLSDPYGETGRIVFEIKVNGSGDVIQVRTKQGTTVSLQVSNHYKQIIQGMSFAPTSDKKKLGTYTGEIKINLVPKG